jgi:hypothetical protein
MKTQSLTEIGDSPRWFGGQFQRWTLGRWFDGFGRLFVVPDCPCFDVAVRSDMAPLSVAVELFTLDVERR